MKRKYLDDGCKWCSSQEWNEDFTDVEHSSDCPAPLLVLLSNWYPIGTDPVIRNEIDKIRQTASIIIGE